jgi:hypothetical protein
MAQFQPTPDGKQEQKPNIPDYNKEERAYLGYIKTRIQNAKVMRDRPHDEFDRQTFLGYTESNRKLMNTYVEPKHSKSDNNTQRVRLGRRHFPICRL